MRCVTYHKFALARRYPPLAAVPGKLFWVAAIFSGLRAGVIAIVAAAVIRIGVRALRTPAMVAIAAAAFGALFAFKVPFPAIVIGAGLTGLVGARWAPTLFAPAPLEAV